MEEWEKHFWNLLEMVEKEFGDFCQQVDNTVEEITEIVDFIGEEVFDLIALEIEDLSDFFKDLIETEKSANFKNSSAFTNDFSGENFVNENEQIAEEIEPNLDNIRNNLEESLNSLDSLESLENLEFYHTPKIEPTATFNPACIGCKNYHGHLYGRNILVCGMHPYGWDDDNCPDFFS